MFLKRHWWLWSWRRWSCWTSWQDDDGERVPEVAADEDDDAGEKGEQGGVVDSVGLQPEKICNGQQVFEKNNYPKPPCLQKILRQSWSPWLLSDRSSHLLCWRKRKQIWEIIVNSFPPAQEAIDEAAKVGWVESILGRKSSYYGIGNTLRHHILQLEWKIYRYLYICETRNHEKDCPLQHFVWLRWIWFHLWYDGEAHGDASDHVGDEPLHGVLGQPCQDRDSAFHLFKDKDRLYPACQ